MADHHLKHLIDSKVIMKSQYLTSPLGAETWRICCSTPTAVAWHYKGWVELRSKVVWSNSGVNYWSRCNMSVLLWSGTYGQRNWKEKTHRSVKGKPSPLYISTFMPSDIIACRCPALDRCHVSYWRSWALSLSLCFFPLHYSVSYLYRRFREDGDVAN